MDAEAPPLARIPREALDQARESRKSVRGLRRVVAALIVVALGVVVTLVWPYE